MDSIMMTGGEKAVANRRVWLRKLKQRCGNDWKQRQEGVKRSPFLLRTSIDRLCLGPCR